MGRALVVAALVIAALVGGGAALIIRAQPDSELAELRLSARRAADGGVELGLQRRAGDVWEARILPDGRFLPADAAVDEWFDSAPFTLREAGDDAGDAAAEPLAQAGEEGAEEEGVSAAEDGADQVGDGAGDEESGDAVAESVDDQGVGEEAAADDEAGTEGGESESVDAGVATVSPADRIIDALAGVRLEAAPAAVWETYLVERGDTLSGIAASFGVTLAALLELNELTAAALLYPDQVLLIPRASAAGESGGELGYVPLEAAPGVVPGVVGETVVYGTIRDQGRGVVHSAALTGAADGAQLVLACAGGRLAVFVLAAPEWVGLAGGASASVSVYYQLGGGALRGDRWEVEGGRIAASDAARFVGELEGRERLSLRAGSLRAEFAVGDLLATPIQANFNNCGG